MAFEEINFDTSSMETAPPPEERSNRAFIIIAVGLIVLALIVVACLAGYALIYVPRQRQNQANQVATVNAQNTEVAKSILATNIAQAFTPTPEVVPTDTPVPVTATNTPVVIIPTNTQIPTADPRTATVAALYTQAAQATMPSIRTPTPTSTALPSTGFADEVGAPAMLGLAILLLVVIFFARRLRSAAG
ncbi:MAG: LPXTG cell wall anchor domain-containing protein [Anaerolineales bacterium]|nr:LPXTG cell wall anchor domain-containing protein [Anaerolineales bacterium]